MSVRDVAALLRTALTKITAARGSLSIVTTGLDEAEATHTQHLQGADPNTVRQILGLLGQAKQGAAALDGLIGKAEGTAKSYLDGLGADADEEPGASDTASTAPTPSPSTARQAKAETLRHSLPEPIKPGEAGRKTHGRWSGADGTVQPIASGRDDMAAEAQRQLDALGIPGVPNAVADVEMKLAAHMAANGIQNATVAINYTPFGCDTLVPALLPEGSTLTVYGVQPDGTRTEDTYRGGAKPWWQR